MRVVLDTIASKTLSRCLFCLARAGNELLINTTSTAFHLSVVDNAGSSHLIFVFGKLFFESFDPVDEIHGRIPLQLFIRAFKIDDYSELEHTEIFGTTENSNCLYVQFIYKLGTQQELQFRFSHGDTFLPTRLTWRHRNYFIASRGSLYRLFNQYGNGLSTSVLIFPESNDEFEGLCVRSLKTRDFLRCNFSLSLIV